MTGTDRLNTRRARILRRPLRRQDGDVTRIPIADGLFTWPSESPRLIGAQCAACGVVAFPTRRRCPGCDGEEMTERLLAPRGTLWTWTTQPYLPKSPPYASGETPETFRPYAVGYVELPDEVIVEARLTEPDPDKLVIGMPMELAVVPFGVRDNGDEVVTYAFRPAAAEPPAVAGPNEREA